MNGVSVCLEEIALEGLDGITLSTLWRRMKSAMLFSVVDDTYKEFLWRCVTSCKDIESFLLPEPRPEINCVDDEKKAYPYHCIKGESVRGSCATFKTRSKIDVSNKSLKNAAVTYGNRLVLVASQLLRNQVLFGEEFEVNVNISEMCYCLLEIIARSRKLGCLHSDLGINTKTDSKNLFYAVKVLAKLDLITKQSVLARRSLATSILYLKKFHIEHSFDSIKSKLSAALNKAPSASCTIESLCKELGESHDDVKKVIDELAKSGHVCYITKEPNNTEILDFVQEQKDNRIVKSVCTFYNLSAEEMDEYEDEEWMQSEYQDLSMNIPAEIPILHVVYAYIAKKGETGASLTECCQALSFPYFIMRKTLYDMECLQMIYCKFVDCGKTKMNVYFIRNDQIFPGKQPSDVKRGSLINNMAMENSHVSAIFSPTDVNPFHESFSGSTEATVSEINNISQSQPSTSKELKSTSAEDCTQAKNERILKCQQHNISSSITTSESLTVKNGNTGGRTRTRAEKTLECESFLRRKQLILNMIKNLKVVATFLPIKQFVTSEERKMGVEVTVDRRSVISLLQVLIEDNLVKKINVKVQIDNDENSVDFYCDSDIGEHCKEFISCLQQFKDKIIVKNANGVNVFSNNQSFETSVLPKCARVEILHMFLYYITYSIADSKDNLTELRKKYDWTEFLSREHTLTYLGKGWFTPYSALMLLPVSLYVKLVKSPLYNVIIKKYYDDPSTRNMLLKDLPPLARYVLYNQRNDFLFGCFEFLVYFGLMTPSNKSIFLHERDVACYLHPCAILKNTRDSEPGYDEVKHPNDEEFVEEKIVFDKIANVEYYWESLRKICFETPLNRRSGPGKKPRPRTHPKNLVNYVVDEKEISEYAKLPGDGLGAAGFDSQIYVHLHSKWKFSLLEKRERVKKTNIDDDLNWQNSFPNDVVNVDLKNAPAKRKRPSKHVGVTKKQKIVENQVNHSNCQIEVIKNQKIGKGPINHSHRSKEVIKNMKFRESRMDHPDCRNKVLKNDMTACVEKRKCEKVVERAETSAKTTVQDKKQKKKKNSKTVPHKKHGHWHTQVHDARDVEALKMKEARTKFSPQQMKLLFICCVAMRIIGRKSTDTGYKDWLWTRDVLYKEDYESSKTKTALSISRKYTTMFKNAQTKKNLEICVAECLQEKEFEPYVNIGKNCEETTFNECVELLKKKYSMQNIVSNSISLPSTTQEFQCQKNSQLNSLEVEIDDKCDSDILTLESREASIADIRQRIIRDAIVSALLLNKTCYKSHIAFRFLSQFSEEELIIAVALLKNARIVVRKQLRHAKNGYDLASCAFSQMLSTHGQYIIDHHFSSELVQEASLFYDEISNACNSSDSHQNFLPLKLSDSSISGGKVHCIFSLLASRRLGVNMHVPNCFLALAGKPTKDTSSCGNKSNSDKKENEGVRTGDVTKKSAGRLTCNVDESINEGLFTKEITNESTDNCAKLVDQRMLKESIDESLNKNFTKPVDEESFSKEIVDESTGGENSTERIDKEMVSHDLRVKSNAKLVENTTESVDEGIMFKDIIDTSKDNNTVSDEEGRVIPGNVNRKHRNDMLLDVLCGIEDHLFGSLHLESETPIYNVALQPSPSFKCMLKTSAADIGSINNGNHVVIGEAEKSSLQDRLIHEAYLKRFAQFQRTGDSNKIYFSINPCKVEVSLLRDIEINLPNNTKNLGQSVKRHFMLQGLRMPQTIEECTMTCSTMFGYSLADCKALTVVYETICRSKEIGVSSDDVKKSILAGRNDLKTMSIDGLIKVLEAFCLVYKVGFIDVCYVAKTFKYHWFLNIQESQEESSSASKKRDKVVSSVEQVSSVLPESPDKDTSTIDFNSESLDYSENNRCRSQVSSETQTENYSDKLCRPWITMSGDVNKNAYNVFHRSVLAYIIRYPGVQKYTICKHFLNVLYPIAIDDILTKLEECDCVERNVCFVERSSLFSSNVKKKSTYYHSKPDALCKMFRRIFIRE
ncbi:general transcription factor 3C polypeptide 1-like [Xenia sp. Carnegie-2017]|uniref:general transcription factor 3C polypeptide 1-like n=1 Tax=Xenia sp. Carnegie-2017 TaxID=2897299 RepID=UPI001F04A8B5|nr:general transcription factor 3C polypeptide 1-like [Xenia sp. Carnegie-2017]